MRTTRFDRRASVHDLLCDARIYYYERSGIWVIRELIARPDGQLVWRYRSESIEIGGRQFTRMARFDDHDAAERTAKQLRGTSLFKDRDLECLSDNGASSLDLKVSKAVVSLLRRENEERLMLAEAKRRHRDVPRWAEAQLILDRGDEAYRTEISNQLQEMPYLRVLLVGARSARAVFRSRDGREWKLAWRSINDRLADIAVHARISEGFGISPGEHWGRTKAQIRRLLLPRANELLQLASVRRMLDEALEAGQKMLVSDPFVFWYEEDGGLGWTVKEIGAASNKNDAQLDGTAEWEAGTVISKNHGRIVVLPFRKENGEKVSGYTRNGPGDGPAKPRHPRQYVEIPFRRLEKDLMIGLWGELPYE